MAQKSMWILRHPWETVILKQTFFVTKVLAYVYQVRLFSTNFDIFHPSSLFHLGEIKIHLSDTNFEIFFHIQNLKFFQAYKAIFWTYDFGYMISCTRLRYTTFRFWLKTNWTSMFSSTTMLTNRNKLWIINCDNLVLVLT